MYSPVVKPLDCSVDRLEQLGNMSAKRMKMTERKKGMGDIECERQIERKKRGEKTAKFASRDKLV